MNVLTVAQALALAGSQGLDRLDAQLLLLRALVRPEHERAWLLAHDSDPLTPQQATAFHACVKRRAGGEPLAYIVCRKEFFGLDLTVDARVLVPRPDTETLVNWALQVLPDKGIQSAPVNLLDLGTGSGAIALALKSTRPDLQVSALDISVDALTVAHNNAQRLQLDIQFRQGSWLDGVVGIFDVIVSNPPYIGAQDTHLNALKHEPLQALVSGLDGLDDIRQIILQTPAYLQPGGWLLLEHGYDQAEKVRNLLCEASFTEVQSKHDLSGIERCSGGRSAQN